MHSPVSAFQTRTVLSADPETSLDESGLQLTDNTRPVCPLSTLRQVPVAASHTLRVLSNDPETTLDESGLRLTDCAQQVCPSNTLRQVPVSAPHTLRVSYDPKTTLEESGLQLTEVTPFEWPPSTLRHSPVSASHTRRVSFSDPETTLDESGLQLTEFTQSVWPLSTCKHSPVVESPTRTVLSKDPEAILEPHGLHATDRTAQAQTSMLTAPVSKSSAKNIFNPLGVARSKTLLVVGESVLFAAVENADAEIIDSLLTAGANFNVVNRTNTTVLEQASTYGHDNIVQRLLDAGADPSHPLPSCSLLWAAVNSHASTVKMLLERVAVVSQRDAAAIRLLLPDYDPTSTSDAE